MLDSSEKVASSPQEPQKGENKIEELKRKIKEAGDNLIRLRKKSISGNPLFLMVTHREFEPYPDALERYRKHADTKTGYYLEPIRGVCWLTMFEEREGGNRIPVARYWWSIRGETFAQRYALGSGNRSLLLEDRNEIANSNPDVARAESLWSDNEDSFLVDDGYQKQGIGTFMLSASVAAMDAFGIRRFQPTALLVPSAQLWSRAGLITLEDNKGPDWEIFYMHPSDKYIHVKDALAKPLIQDSISEFV